MTALLTARQVANMVGPDTPGCDCEGCKELVQVKGLICDAVTGFSDAMQPEDIALPWLMVMMIAASRLRAQGVDHRVLANAAARGVDQAEILNPLLCLGLSGTAPGATHQ
jgi:hypothetical protein